MAVGSTLIPRKAEAASSEVDMNKIYSIESSNNPQAHNKTSNAKGLGQITPIVLKEWNNFHPKDRHSDGDLFNADTNKKIASWYMNKRIPQMLKAKGLKDTPENRLVAYNAGISKVGKILPRETANYIKKYKQQKAS
jgi:soluble lytic murein transglycosylase-like protein